MKKFNFIMAMAILFSVNAMAEQLTVKQAVARFAKKTNKVAAQAGTASDFQLAYTATVGDKNCFYVVNNTKNGGFNVVAADDCAPAVLMSIDDATFVADQIPTQMQGMLAHYQNIIATAIASGKTIKKVTPNEAKDVDILMRTVWQQSAPFNNYCTELLDAGLVPANEKSIVGCVATAMSQCLFYFWDKWNYAAQPQGSVNYTINYKGNSSIAETKAGDVTVDKTFGDDDKIEYENMILQYDGYKYSEEQGNAVAKLSHFAGITLKMNYEDKTGGSGTADENIPVAFKDNWGFDPEVKYVERDKKDGQEGTPYSDQEWADLIFGELKGACPVMYGAVGRKADGTSGGGHEFVIDGYRTSDDLFHVNWGWENGYCNGWCYLCNEDIMKVLLPTSEVAGSTGSADSTNDPYANGQGAIINIKPVGFASMEAITPQGKEGEKAGTTGIAEVTKTVVDGATYNLAGQRVNSNTKGLVIVNGKKFINK